MSMLFKNARVLCHVTGRDEPGDIAVSDGRLVRVESVTGDYRVFDCQGKWLMPGLFGLGVHLREPGYEYKETIAATCSRAAASGFAGILALPTTKPVLDTASLVSFVSRQATAGPQSARLLILGAATLGGKGESLSEMHDLRGAGAVGVFQGPVGEDVDVPPTNAAVLRRAMEYAAGAGLTFVRHCEDADLAQGGSMNEGEVSNRLGILARPAVAETAAIARDLALCAYTRARLHITRVSTAEGVARIREAKAAGVPVTCDVTAHHLRLTEEACGTYGPETKSLPPLRADADRRALQVGLADGTIDAISVDHCPQTSLEKDLEFENAAFGQPGLQTAIGATLPLVEQGQLSALRWVAALSKDAVSVVGGAIKEPSHGDGWSSVKGLVVGAAADITVIDPSAACDIPSGSPFFAETLQGRPVLTVVNGRLVFQEEGAF